MVPKERSLLPLQSLQRLSPRVKKAVAPPENEVVGSNGLLCSSRFEDTAVHTLVSEEAGGGGGAGRKTTSSGELLGYRLFSTLLSKTFH